MRSQHPVVHGFAFSAGSRWVGGTRGLCHMSGLFLEAGGFWSKKTRVSKRIRKKGVMFGQNHRYSVDTERVLVQFLCLHISKMTNEGVYWYRFRTCFEYYVRFFSWPNHSTCPCQSLAATFVFLRVCTISASLNKESLRPNRSAWRSLPRFNWLESQGRALPFIMQLQYFQFS